MILPNLSPYAPPMRIYTDLANWYPLLTPRVDYKDEAVVYQRIMRSKLGQGPLSLLELGCGAGHNASVAGAKNPPKSGENRTPSHNRRSNYFAARAAAFACRSSFASLRRYESATNFTISA